VLVDLLLTIFLQICLIVLVDLLLTFFFLFFFFFCEEFKLVNLNWYDDVNILLAHSSH